jgi:hypothetical protein
MTRDPEPEVGAIEPDGRVEEASCPHDAIPKTEGDIEGHMGSDKANHGKENTGDAQGTCVNWPAETVHVKTEDESSAEVEEANRVPGDRDARTTQADDRTASCLINQEAILDRLESLRIERLSLQNYPTKLDAINREIDGLLQSLPQSMRSVPTMSTTTTFGTKRKFTPQPKEPAKKKARKGKEPPAISGRRGREAQKSNQVIVELLRNHDHVAAGREMADLPVLSSFAASTVKDQQKQFQELVTKDATVDTKKVRGDTVMLGKARVALKGRWTVSGEKYLVKGMKTPLFGYQFVAAGWMVGREKSNKAPNGGILADSMGLGKTVETLACIAGNPPSKEDLDNGLRTTLVVVPANAVAQWINEIWKHGDGIIPSHYKRADMMAEAGRNYAGIW